MDGECKRTRRLCKRLAAVGAACYPLVASRRTPSGWPDRLIGWSNFWILVEFKTGNKWLRKSQESVIRRFSAPCLVARFEGDQVCLYTPLGEPVGSCDSQKVSLFLQILEKYVSEFTLIQ